MSYLVCRLTLTAGPLMVSIDDTFLGIVILDISSLHKSAVLLSLISPRIIPVCYYSRGD